MLDDLTALLLDDVSNLKSFRTNMAGGFEELSTRAIAINKDIFKAYGGTQAQEEDMLKKSVDNLIKICFVQPW